MDDILQVNERLRGLIWGAPMLILLLGTGLYFTAVTGVFQVRYCALWLRKTLFSCFTGAARRTSGGVSPFAAMCTALAATVGTGNIAGVATALTLGGPGAVLWLWVSAFVGMMTAFAENTLGMLYRERERRQLHGGAMLYLKNGLHSPLLWSLCAVLCWHRSVSAT
ncbi:MAG: alanine:cation symporter family protein [Butyricicoccus sp.]